MYEHLAICCEGSLPLTRITQHESSAYTSCADYSPSSGAYLRGRLDVFFDVRSLQVGSVAPRDKTPPPVAGPSTPSDRLSPLDPAALSSDSDSSSCATVPALIPVSAPAPALAPAPAPVPALDSPSATVLQDDSQNVPVSQNATLSLLVAARPSPDPSSHTLEASTTAITSDSSSNPSVSTSGISANQDGSQDIQNAVQTSDTSKATSKKALVENPMEASAKKPAKGPAKRITAR